MYKFEFLDAKDKKITRFSNNKGLRDMDYRYEAKGRIPRSYMNEAEGIVKEIQDKRALVLIDRQAMCGQCSAKGFCDMLGGGKEVLSETLNDVGAEVGDTVTIGLPFGAVTKASMVVYMIPLMGLIGGAIIGYLLGGLYGFDVNVSTLICSFACLGVSMIAVKFASVSLSKKPSFQPEIIKIVNPEKTE
jgi:sigma-E factor negative regulatory protein RseC